MKHIKIFAPNMLTNTLDIYEKGLLENVASTSHSHSKS